LDVLVTSPTYGVQGRRLRSKALDVSVTYRAADGAMYVNVLNRSAKDDIEASVENQTGAAGATAEVWQMNHDNLKEVHTLETIARSGRRPRRCRAKERTVHLHVP